MFCLLYSPPPFFLPLPSPCIPFISLFPFLPLFPFPLSPVPSCYFSPSSLSLYFYILTSFPSNLLHFPTIPSSLSSLSIFLFRSLPLLHPPPQRQPSTSLGTWNSTRKRFRKVVTRFNLHNELVSTFPSGRRFASEISCKHPFHSAPESVFIFCAVCVCLCVGVSVSGCDLFVFCFIVFVFVGIYITCIWLDTHFPYAIMFPKRVRVYIYIRERIFLPEYMSWIILLNTTTLSYKRDNSDRRGNVI